MDQSPPKYVCIHGHFYQPPRENPWLEEIEVQDSAFPYHDWNERITAECYAPNTASRILNPDLKIIDIVNNYSKISFNFGPTLLYWMEQHAADIYNAILEADRVSRENFSGHGGAIAQVYNHMIMPLANDHDRETQVVWGIADFERRFGRKPEGMWLAETAVDLKTLETLARHGIKFTILTPRQAHKTRKIGTNDWIDVTGEKIDTKVAYICNLPSGASINLFFYDGAIARDIAFGNLLASGLNFAHRITGAFAEQSPTPQLVHVATDGETYGHHYRRADMALAYCLYNMEAEKHAKITVYGEFLELHPPSYEVEIHENTSWSCIHGIERWRSDCGCNTGAGWKQPWRALLREAMDWLRDQLIPLYEREIGVYVNDDPWEIRNRYIEVILDRSDANVERFLAHNLEKVPTAEERRAILSLLEMQRNAMLMYTSCGWFFDEISGIETTQVIDYASRAIHLAQKATGVALESEYQLRLGKAPTNIPDFQNGARIYEMFVKPVRIDLFRVAAHYAVSSLFTTYPEQFQIFCYRGKSSHYERLEAGRLKLAIGRANFKSDLTWSQEDISFAVLHLGDFNLNGGTRKFVGDEAYNRMREEIKGAFAASDIPAMIRLMDFHFRTHEYTLWTLFRDEQRKVIGQILSATRESIERSYRQIYQSNYSLINMMVSRGNPLPKVVTTTVEFILNEDLRQMLESDAIDVAELEKIIQEVRKWPIELDRESLSIIARNAVRTQMKKLRESPLDLELWKVNERMIHVLNLLKMDMGLWETQNIYFRIGKEFYEPMQKKAESGEEAAVNWIEHFNKLGEDLGVKIT